MSQTHVLNGNEIAIDRATPKEKVALLPGRLRCGPLPLPDLAWFSTGGITCLICPACHECRNSKLPARRPLPTHQLMVQPPLSPPAA